MLLTRSQWVAKYYPDAYQATRGTGIFPETLLAIAIVESQGEGPDGNYYPGLGLQARKANNYFGIKDYPKWTGQTILLPTSKDAQKFSRFCVYPSIGASFKGFVEFLQRNPVYTKKGVFRAQDYTEQIAAIAAAGYAEAGNYKTTVTNVAGKIREYAKGLKDYAANVQAVANNNSELLPILLALGIVGAVVLTNKLKK